MVVNRCICNNLSFAEALLVARREGCRNVRDLQRHSTLGSGCGLCIPYMQCAIETGESNLPILSPLESQALMFRSGLVLEEGM